MKKSEEEVPSVGLRPPRHAKQAPPSFQALLVDISSRFVTMLPGQVDETIEEVQRIICEKFRMDRATLWQSTPDGTQMLLTHFWQKPGCVPLRRNYPAAGNLRWVEAMVRRGAPFHFSSLRDLPSQATADEEAFRIYGTKSKAIFPLVAEGRVFGAVTFATSRCEHSWSHYEISELTLIAQIFGHVISRRRAEERADQLRDEIERSSRASVVGELAAALAHEINQPLTTILGNAQAARRFIDQQSGDPAEIRAILDDIIRDDKRAAQVISNLRLMLADSTASRESSCLNELVNEVIEFIRPEISGCGIVLRLELADFLPPVHAARVEIQQVLTNLISNAVHAMKETPPDQRQLTIRSRTVGIFAKLDVRDHGCGISPEHLDRIFKPFHTTRKDGLGMGLAICRRIIDAHGGSIRAQNHQFGGAVFEISLPVHCEET